MLTSFRYILTLLLIGFSIGILAQTGPGGVGSSTSTTDSLLIWLRADSLISVDGSSFVTSWGDISGNGNDFTLGNGSFPFNTSGLNGRPTVDFTEPDATIGELDGPIISTLFGLTGNDPILAGDVIIVFEQVGSNSGYTFQFARSDGSSFLTLVSRGGSGGAADNNENDDVQVFARRTGGDTFAEISSQGTANDNIFTNDNFHIARYGFNPDADTVWLYHNGTFVNSTDVNPEEISYGTGTITGTARMGSSGGGQDYDGQIAEFIVYSDELSQAENIILHNYLNARYGLTISNDFYVGTGFSEDVIGIGNEGSSNHMASTGAGGGLYLVGTAGTSTTTFDSDEWLFAGHNGGVTTNTFSDVPDAGKTRLDRIWKLEKTEGALNAGFDVTVTFDLGELNLIEYPGLTLYRRTATTGDFTNLGLTPSISGDEVSFTLTDADSDNPEQYFTLAYDAPTPGGIGANLALWLQANSGVAITGTSVDSWEDQGTGIGNASDPMALADYIANSTNFNPGIVFDSDATSLEGSITTTLSNLTFFTVFQDNSGANSGLALFEFNSGQSHPLYDNSYGGGAAFSANIAKDRTTLLTIDHPSGTSANIFQDGASFESSYTTVGNSAAGTYNYTLGDDDGGGNAFTGTLNELIAFEATLTTDQREQIESYLAVKYGISLTHDYLRSDGTLVFDVDNSSLNDGYENDITSIGSDITAGLNQKISKGVADSLVISTEDNFTNANASNSTSLSDDSFFFVSNNGASFGTVLSNSQERLNRVWKVTESGTVGAVYLGLPNSLNEFGSMLVSTDPTFSTGVTEVFASENGTYSAVNHDFTSGDYFTFTVKQTLGTGNDNLLVWLRADVGVTTSGSNVTLWEDQSRYGNDANDDDTEFDEESALAVQDEDPVTLNAEGFNFNPSIASNGADRPLSGSFTTTEAGMTMFVVGREEDVASGNHAWFDSFDDGAPGLGAIYRSYLFENEYNNGADFAEFTNEDTLTIYTIEHPASALVDIYENGFLYQDDYSADNTHAPGFHHYVVADDVTGGNEFIGQIAEIMFYQGALTTVERQSIQSYLAMKYGVSLLDDYVASDGTVLLDISSDGNFDQNISALARNSTLLLDQKVSRTEFGNLVIATTQDFESANASRMTSLSNGQYFLTSSNEGSVASDSSYRSFNGNRLGRKWKVNETNNPGVVYVGISDTVAANFNVLLVSSDSTFSSGVTEVPLSQSGGFYYSNNDFADGEFFTFANSVSPGGVNNGLQAWLKADSELTVNDWGDQSGNDNDATSPENDPTIVSTGINFNPAVQFSTAGDRMQGTISTGTDSLSYLIVAQDVSSASSGGVMIEFDATTDLTLNDGSYAGLTFATPANIIKDTAQLISVVHPEGVGPATVYLNGSSFETGAVSAAESTTYTYSIGDDVASANGFDGLVSEVIVYDAALTDADREMLESYLAVKYALPVSHDIVASEGSVILDATASSGYLNGLVGLGYDVRTQLDQKVGRSPYDSLRIATTDDFITANAARPTAYDDLQYTLITSDGGAFTITEDYKAETNARLERVWEIHELNNPGAVVLALPNSGVFTTLNTILISSDPTFTTGVTEQSLTVSGTNKVVSIDLTDGLYFTFTTSAPESNIWYSYLSGNWSDPGNWTLDGAISPLYLNPSNEIPSEGDTVVVKSGRTIISDVNGILVERAEVIGNLDLASTGGHTLTYLLGNGTLRLSGASGLDNYPAAIDTLFYSASEGGTVEYYGAGLSLDSKRNYNNLVVNLDNSTNEVEQAADSIWVYGNMTITQGVYQFGSNSIADSLVNEVRGDVLVESNGGIEVGATESRHEFNLYGDFINQGIAEFTNRTIADYANEALDGIVDVNFVSGTQDQNVDLQNTTTFYRIEINKGVDDTYKVTLAADDAAFFSLFGFAEDGHGSIAQLTDNDNALGLIYGTVEIGNNIQIGELTDSGNYNISEGASLVINGGSVDGSRWVVTYGSLIMNAGTLDLGIGTVLRNSGFWEVHGGTIDMGHFRTSALGAGNDGSWTQTGGIVNLTGSGSQAEYYTFSLTYETCSFTMTGGELNVSAGNNAPTGLKGIFLNAATENQTVSGGTITLDMVGTENDTTYITSSVPFYNLTILQSASGIDPDSKVMVTGGNSGGIAPDGVDLASQALTVLNDLTIGNVGGIDTTQVDFDGNDVNITGNLVLRDSALVDFSEMTLTMEGFGASQIDVQIPDQKVVLDSLVINKSNELVLVTVTNGYDTLFEIEHYLSIANGNFDVGTFDIQLDGDLNLADTLGSSGSTGILYMLGESETVAQTITSTTGGFVYDLLVDNNSNLTLSGGELGLDSLDLNDGIFDLGTNKLTMNSEVESTGTFASDLMLETAGNSSDGGLEYYFDGTANPIQITYPLGANSKYTPAQVDLINVSDNGYIQINPVDGELLTTDLTGGNILDYYWRVRNSNFSTLPDVSTLTFTANAADDPTGGPLTSFVPGAVEGGIDSDDTPATDTDFNRFYENNGITGLVIEFDGEFSTGNDQPFQLRTANYTAGVSTRFPDSSPDIYFTTLSANRQNWATENAWTLVDGTDGADDGNTGFPGAGDIAVLRNYGNGSDDHWVTLNTDITVAQLIFDNSLGGWTPRAIVSDRDANLDIGPVSGVGQFQLFVDASNTPAFIGTTDLGDFSSQTNSQFNFRLAADGTAQMPNNITEYPQVRIEAGNGDNDDDDRILETSVPITINSFLQLDRSPRFRINHDVTVVGDVRVTWQLNRTTIEIGDDREVTFDIGGDLLMRDGAGDDAARFLVKNDNLNGYEHTVRVRGDIEFESGLEATSAFDLYNGASPNNNAILELSGEGNFSLTNNASGVVTPDLYRIVMNAGSDTTNTFTFNDTFTLSGDNTTDPQSIELQNGKLILNDPSINVELADGSDFTIPASAGLEVTQGAVTSTGANIILDGLLRINGGTATLASTDIEYSSSGNALIDITTGTLNIGGQVRRSLTASNGILKYRQSGGDVDIATDVADNNTRGSFEVLNIGSEFTLTGGTFNIERGVTGDANLSLRLDPATSDVSGSTITIFENLGADYGSNFFNVGSAIALNNLTIANSINLPDVQLFNQNLEVNDLTINTNQTLLANSFNLTLNGNFSNSGTYTNTSTETILAGTGAQLISGGGSFTIFDLRKNGSGTTTSNVSLDIDHDLILEAGTLDIGANAINLNNDAFIQSTLTNTGGNGLVFNGTANQELNGLSNNAIDIGTITISNSNGVDIPDGNGYDFNVTQELRLNGGVFNIGGSLVTMVAGAPITESSTFGVNNMVQTNSSFTDNGLKIDFFEVAVDTTVFFPVGELKYTPVQFDLNAATTTGSIRVRPANERHPTIINDAEPGTVEDPEIDDTQNVLQYHWIVVAADLSNANGSATFFYDNDDITNIETDTANFISARLLANDVNWDKFDPTLFLGASQTFQVPLNTFTATEITGDYTAGAGSSDGVNADIEGAIPDQLAQYETSLLGTGDYSLAANWSTINGPNVTDGVGPVGAQIIIRSGDDLTLNLDNTRLYATEIEAGAILRVPAGTTGVRLGTVTGSGTIVLEDNELLPTGEYTDFFQCSGGALQYSGSTSYNVLTGVSQIRKVILEGSGSRTLPNNLISICDTLEINGPTVVLNSGLTYAVGDTDDDLFDIQAGIVTLTNGSDVNISGDFEMSGGSFTGAANTAIAITDDVILSGGTLNWNGTDITLNGSSEQLIDGAFTGSAGFEDLIVNNSGAGVTLNSGDVEVSGVLTLTDGLVNTSTTETLTLTSTGDWTGASTASYITGPLSKNSISATSTYEFPVGKSVRYAPASIVNVGTGGDDWTAEYFTSTNPTYSNLTFDNSDPGSGFNELSDVESSDRWEITSAGSNTAQVRATYGSHNAFPGTNIRLVWWDDETTLDGDGADNRWENQGGQVVGNATAGTVTSENTIFFSTRQFGVGYAPESLLPVELLDFSAEAKDNKVRLSWSTVSELNNDYFEILHSTNGIDFESIGKVQGNGSTNELIEYTLTHGDPVLGDNYYQLKQVDYDGAETLYEIIKVYNDYYQASMDITVYPNPATNENLRLRISTGDDHTPISVRIVDLNGKIHYQRVLNGSLSIDERVKPDLNMTSGIYFMIIEQGDQVSKKKIVIR